MDTPPPREWEAQLSVQPRTSGEQAGLYAYADERSWVKLVIEGQADGGVSLVFASQHAAVPFVAGKLPLPDYRGSCWLRLTADDAGGVVASYRLTGGSWAMVPRGLGWLNAHENAHELEHARAEQAVAEDATNGRLELGDPRGGLRAFCRLPEADWTAALVTEQFGVPCPVHFAHLAVTGATPRPAVAALAEGALALALGERTDVAKSFSRNDFVAIEDHVGEGYGHPTDEGRAAMDLFGEDGISLDLTYTAKAAAGLLSRARTDPSRRRYLFWNTLSSAPLGGLVRDTMAPLPPDLDALLL
jgi:hypothetical protein